MTMPWGLFLLLGFVAFLVNEVVALATARETLSAFLARQARRRPLIPFVACFAAGVLAGHFWWPQCP